MKSFTKALWIKTSIVFKIKMLFYNLAALFHQELFLNLVDENKTVIIYFV
ncbi:MAG: hypothetical protein QT12_C0002G0002 [archaeon GW2011_AR21]|nr:MAG: hypothetical protein QT12_C0002G0002 [archaeon GW2011_AR21]